MSRQRESRCVTRLSDDIQADSHVLVESFQNLDFGGLGDFEPRVVRGRQRLFEWNFTRDDHGQTKAVLLARTATIVLDGHKSVRFVRWWLASEDGLRRVNGQFSNRGHSGQQSRF